MTAAIWVGAAVLAVGALWPCWFRAGSAVRQAQVEPGAEPGLVSA